MTLLTTARLVKEALGSNPTFLPGVENILFLLIQGTHTTAQISPLAKQCCGSVFDPNIQILKKMIPSKID